MDEKHIVVQDPAETLPDLAESEEALGVRITKITLWGKKVQNQLTSL